MVHHPVPPPYHKNDITKSYFPLAAVGGIVALAFGGGIAWSKLNAAIDGNRDKIERDIAGVQRDITTALTGVQVSINDIKNSIRRTSERVVGKTPEGFHRRDCQDLVEAIEVKIASQMASETYKIENADANRTILRALANLDCYELQGVKSRAWRATVKVN